ncbi:MAG: signal peptidase I, partial [Actinomycetota bacterium]|nr:signal peptidase I [Actinomycetota bacterium]
VDAPNRNVGERSGSPDGPHAPRSRSIGGLARLVIAVVLIVAAAVAVRTYVVAPYFIPSASMETTLHGCSGCNNDHVLVNKLSYHLHSVHRGDVVVFNRPSGWNVNDKVLIKRVIGLPGDVLTEAGGMVYVNGAALEEPYLNVACRSGTQNLTRITVPAHQLFVMGDNRCESADSRSFGPIKQSNVIGRAFLIIWPLGRLHYL